MRSTLLIIATLSAIPFLPLAGCDKKHDAPPPAPAAKGDDHAHGAGDSHADAKPGPGHGGPVIDLGELDVGPFHARATRDAGEIVAGKEAGFDVTITPRDSAGPKVAAVRFWLGTQDAKGSVKARAEVEDPKDPNRWHTHAEVPGPLPAGSRFWFEIEDDQGGKHLGSFELKP